ncbi:hypothetical protein BH10BAC3_BH10BAC3_40850 [soil metagenome]
MAEPGRFGDFPIEFGEWAKTTFQFIDFGLPPDFELSPDLSGGKQLIFESLILIFSNKLIYSS